MSLCPPSLDARQSACARRYEYLMPMWVLDPLVGQPRSAALDPLVGQPQSAALDPLVGQTRSAALEPLVGQPQSAALDPRVGQPQSAALEPLVGPPRSAAVFSGAGCQPGKSETAHHGSRTYAARSPKRARTKNQSTVGHSCSGQVLPSGPDFAHGTQSAVGHSCSGQVLPSGPDFVLGRVALDRINRALEGFHGRHDFRSYTTSRAAATAGEGRRHKVLDTCQPADASLEGKYELAIAGACQPADASLEEKDELAIADTCQPAAATAGEGKRHKVPGTSQPADASLEEIDELATANPSVHSATQRFIHHLDSRPDGEGRPCKGPDTCLPADAKATASASARPSEHNATQRFIHQSHLDSQPYGEGRLCKGQDACLPADTKATATASASPSEHSATQRFIHHFYLDSQPVLVDGQYYVKFVVRGTSFMMYQIRKMVGLAIAVARGTAPPDCIAASLQPGFKLSVPTAPAEGLLL
eukprot:gene30320-35312_t